MDARDHGLESTAAAQEASGCYIVANYGSGMFMRFPIGIPAGVQHFAAPIGSVRIDSSNLEWKPCIGLH